MKKTLLIGLLLSISGVCLLLVPLKYIQTYYPNSGIIENIKHIKAEFFKTEKVEFITSAEFRSRFPMYWDLDDEELFGRIYARFLTVFSEKEARRFFFSEKLPLDAEHKTYDEKHNDPLDLRGDMEYVKPSSPMEIFIFSNDARDYGFIDENVGSVVVPYRYLMIAGLVLIALGLFFLSKSKRKSAV